MNRPPPLFGLAGLLDTPTTVALIERPLWFISSSLVEANGAVRQGHLLRTSCQTRLRASAPSTGIAQSSDSSDGSQALSLVCCGTTSAHAAVFYYGAISAITGSAGLLFIGRRQA